MGSTKFKLFIWLSWLLLLLALESTAKIGFYSQNEYRYEYIGQVRTGLPNVGKDKTAVGIIAAVLVQPLGSDLIVQLSDIRTFTGIIEGYEETINEIPLNYKQLQDQTDLRRPFKITYHANSDKFKGIEISNKDTPASVNIKKALAVFLNVRLDQQVSKRQGYFASSSPAANFEPIDVDESGIEGICTTKYIYQQLPWPGNPKVHVLNVTKIRDVKSCEEEAIWRTSIQEAQKCSSCESAHASFINHGSVAHYNVYEENGQYVLQEAENHGQADVTPFPPEGDKLRITQFQKLKLIEIRRASGRAPNLEPTLQEPSMTIVPEEINLQARYKRYTKTSGTKISPLKLNVPKEPYKQEDPKTKVKKILEVISSKPIDSRGEVLNLITITVSNSRFLTYEDIQEIYDSIGNQEDKKKLFIDVVVMTGTDASIIFIKYLIEQGKINGEHAAQVISALPAYILEPKPAILEELWALCKGRLAKENRQIYVTTLLTFGELVNQACVPKLRPKSSKPYHVKVKGCPKALTTRYLQELMNQFEQTNEMWEKSSIMYAIYRMGLNDTLDFLIPYLQGKIFTLPSGLRSEMLITLFEVGPGRQQEVAKYLLPLFYNASLGTEERIFAFEVLGYTTTSQEIMNQLALSTWHEHDSNVAIYIYNYLNAVRKITLPCWIPMAVRSQHAFLLAKPASAGLLDSRIYTFSSYAEKWSMGSSFNYGFLHTSKSLFPKMTFLHIGKELAGYYYAPLEVLSINDGMQTLLDHLIGPQADFTEKKFSDIFKYDTSPTGSTGTHGKEEFIVTPRKEDPFYTRIMFSYLHNRHRLFFLDQDTLKDIRNSGIIPPNKDLYSVLRDGIPINYRKHLLLEDTELKFTSIIGLPLRIEFKMPSSIDVRGKISVEVSKGGMYHALSHIVFKPEIDYSLALNAWVGVYTDSILENKIVVAKATGNIFVSSSIHGYVNVDFTQNSFTASVGKANIVTKQKQQPILSAYILPSLYVFDRHTDAKIQETIVNGTDSQREKDIIVDGVSGLPFGNSFIIKSISDLPIQQEKKLWRDLKKEGLLHLLSYGWAPRRFNQKSIDVVLDPQYSDTEKVELTVNWKHSPTPYEEELWSGKSVLQQLRLWNIIPEWKDAVVSCKDVQSPARIQVATEAPKKKSWFSRFKDKVKTTFGRSGGDSEEEDDDDETEDRGRALHPHIATGDSGTGSRSGGRSSLTSETGQPRSTGYGESGSDYSHRQHGTGQGYDQTHYGAGHGYGQTQYGEATTQGYGQGHGTREGHGQTQYGSGPGYGQSQSGDDYDFEQKPSSSGQDVYGQTSQGGYGQHGEQPPRPGSSYDSDRLRGKKALVRKLFFKNEVSTTLIAIKLNTLGATKRQIMTDVTISKNAPQGINKLSVVMDFQNIFKQQQKNVKVCLNGDFISSYIQCQTQDKTFPRFDYKLQWGEVCDNKNYVSIKGAHGPGPDASTLWQKYQAQCANDMKTGFLRGKHCNQSFEDAYYTLLNVKYEIHYSQPPSQFLTKVGKTVDGYLKCHLSDFLLEDTYHVVNNEEGLISAELNYHPTEPLVDIHIKKPKEDIALNDVQYEKFSPFLQPRSTAFSYSLNLGRTWTNDKIINKCVIRQDGIITTFNSVPYNYTLDGCQHILAKDCSTSNLFTVSLSGSQNNKIKLEILGHIIDSTSSLPVHGSKFEFLVDGKSDFIEDGQIAVIRSQGNEDRFLAQISYSGPQVTIKAPSLGLTITYSQQFVLVIISPFWKGKVCGLCGENTDDESKTFLGPDQCLYNDGSAFARSYRVKGPQCPTLGYQGKPTAQCLPLAQEHKFERIREPITPVSQTTGDIGSRHEAELVQVPGSTGYHQGYGGQTTQTNDEDHYTGGSSGQSSTGAKVSGQESSSCYSGSHLIKTKTTNYKGKNEKQYCFSSEFVRQCHPSCHAVDFEYKTVHFNCYLASLETAQQMFQDAQKGKSISFPSASSSISTFEEEMMVAQKCNPKY